MTYKWPAWLHKQTDKQRIIWAYKILFLDVLFPLEVPRVIFVDSDQVGAGLGGSCVCSHPAGPGLCLCQQTTALLKSTQEDVSSSSSCA